MVLVPGVLALIFDWLALRAGITGVYLSILTQAMTLAMALYLFQNDSGLRGSNGLSGLQNLPGLSDLGQDRLSIWFFWASACALGLVSVALTSVVSGKFGSVIRAIRDDEPRVEFLGYSVEIYKLFVFTLTATICAIGGAELSAGGHHQRGRTGAYCLSLSCGLGGDRRARQALWRGDLGVFRSDWVNWWQVVLGVVFVLVTLFAPKGIGGLFDLAQHRRGPDRKDAPLGPEDSALQVQEALESTAIWRFQASLSPLTGSAPSTTCPFPLALQNCGR